MTALFLAALSAFLLRRRGGRLRRRPGAGHAGTLLRSTTLAGPALVVAVLLLLAAPAELRPLWWLATAASAAWAATALWLNRGADPPEG